MNFYAVTALCALVSIIIISIVTYIKAGHKPESKKFFFFNGIIVLWVLGCFTESTTDNAQLAYIADVILYCGAIYSPVIYLDLIYTIIDKRKAGRQPVLILGYALASVFFLFNLIPSLRPYFISDVARVYDFRFISVPNIGWHIFLAFYLTFGTVTPYVLLTKFRNAQGLAKEQIKYFLVSYAVIATAGVMYFGLVLKLLELPVDNFFTISYGVITSYAIIKYRLMDIRIAVTRAGLAIGTYAVVLGIPFYMAYSAKTDLLPVFMMFVTATLGPLWYRSLQKRAENLLLAEQRRYQKVLLKAASCMVREHDLDKLLSFIVDAIKYSVEVDFVALYLKDEEDNYILKSVKGAETSCMSYAKPHALIAAIRNEGNILSYNEIPAIVKEHYPTSALIIPSCNESGLMSFLIVGSKNNRSLYTDDDIEIFNVLSRQIALAIEHCLFLKEYALTKAKMFNDQKRSSLYDLMAGIVHKVNNGLNNIYAPARTIQDIIEDLLKENPDLATRESVRKYIDDASDAANRIANNVQKTTDIFARANYLTQAGIEETHFEKHSLQHILGTALDVVKTKYKIKELPVQLELPQDDFVYGVKKRLTDILENIISNAYIATIDKLEYISEEENMSFIPFIRVSLKNGGDKHCIAISDNGIGIRDENKERVFKPFRSTASPFIRSGMGMYIVKLMVEDIHNGKIWYETEYLKGTTFYVELPKGNGKRTENSHD